MNTFVIAGPNTITVTAASIVGGSPAIGGQTVTMQGQCNTDTFSVTGRLLRLFLWPKDSVTILCKF